jgi:hypothetical protein
MNGRRSQHSLGRLLSAFRGPGRSGAGRGAGAGVVPLTDCKDARPRDQRAAPVRGAARKNAGPLPKGAAAGWAASDATTSHPMSLDGTRSGRPRDLVTFLDLILILIGVVWRGVSGRRVGAVLATGSGSRPRPLRPPPRRLSPVGIRHDTSRMVEDPPFATNPANGIQVQTASGAKRRHTSPFRPPCRPVCPSTQRIRRAATAAPREAAPDEESRGRVPTAVWERIHPPSGPRPGARRGGRAPLAPGKHFKNKPRT